MKCGRQACLFFPFQIENYAHIPLQRKFLLFPLAQPTIKKGKWRFAVHLLSFLSFVLQSVQLIKIYSFLLPHFFLCLSNGNLNLHLHFVQFPVFLFWWLLLLSSTAQNNGPCHTLHTRTQPIFSLGSIVQVFLQLESYSCSEIRPLLWFARRTREQLTA